MAKRKPNVTIVGAGNVARALALLLPKAGQRVQEIVTRQGSKKPRLRGPKAVSMAQAKFGTEIVWLAVTDNAINSCARDIATRTDWRNKIVFHSSGALTSDELDPLRRRGASVASVHPMMTFVPGKVPNLKGVAWAIEGDSKAVKAASSIVRSLGGVAFKVVKSNKPLYHAFGAFLSPLLVVHLDRAAELAVRAGIPRKDVPRFMSPIILQTVENLYASLEMKGETGAALSGPLVRGDIGTIERHLKALSKSGAGKLYRALIEAAMESNLPIRNRAAIRRSLRSR